MNETLGIKGKLKIELIRDGKVIETKEKDNVITTAGKYLICQLITGAEVTEFTHMAIGTNATTEDESDTILGSESGRVILTARNVSSNVITYIGDFPAGTGTGTITEAGIFNDGTEDAGTMLNRAVFSAISKTAADALKITWTVTFS